MARFGGSRHAPRKRQTSGWRMPQAILAMNSSNTSATFPSSRSSASAPGLWSRFSISYFVLHLFWSRHRRLYQHRLQLLDGQGPLARRRGSRQSSPPSGRGSAPSEGPGRRPPHCRPPKPFPSGKGSGTFPFGPPFSFSRCAQLR